MNVNFNNIEAICNTVRKRFPYTSPWELRNIKIRELDKALQHEKNPQIRSQLNREITILSNEYCKKLDFNRLISRESNRYLNKPLQYYKNLIEGIDVFKTLWCGAAAKLMYAACRINGVPNKDIERTFLIFDDGINKIKKELYGDAYIPERVDHVVNRIDTQEGVAEVDTLLGKVYREGKMCKSFETDFREVIKLSEKERISLCSEKDYPIKYQDMPKLDNNNAEKLASEYPELIIEK